MQEDDIKKPSRHRQDGSYHEKTKSFYQLLNLNPTV
jgi:hypothetical protein